MLRKNLLVDYENLFIQKTTEYLVLFYMQVRREIFCCNIEGYLIVMEYIL